MIATAEQMPVCWRCRRLTQTIIWALVMALHGLALWVFADQAVPVSVTPELPLLVSWVAEPPAAAGQSAGQTVSLEQAASAAPQAAPTHKKAVTKRQETITTRSMPTSPAVETTAVAKPVESREDSKPAVVAKTAATTGDGNGSSTTVGGGNSGNGNGAANGSGDGKAASGGSGGGPQKLSASQVRFRQRVPPVYSSVAQERGYQGVARVQIVINQSGQLQQAAISRSSGYAMLDEAAVAAARKSSYYPHVVNGVAQAVSAVIAYRFSLSRSPVKPAAEEPADES